MLKKIMAGVLAALLSWNFAGIGLVHADEIDDVKAKKTEIDRQVQEAKKRHNEARRRAERASSNFKSVVNKLGTLQKRSVVLKNREKELDVSLKDNAVKLEQKKAQFQSRKHIYHKRLRDIYMSGQVNYLDVLLGAQDFGDFVGRMYLLEKVVTSDIDMLREINATVKEIKERTERQTRELAETKENQEQIARDQEAMVELKEKRRKLLEAAEDEELKEETQYNKLIETSERISQMLREMEKANPQRFADKADNFIWPACGVITSYAGWRVHPVFGTTKYHSGMDIAVDYNTPIKAANRGSVTYAGWMDGYGYTVMIDHGEGFVTLYAHCNSINCSEGSFVHQGDVVAQSGATGWATGPHLHFEVRVHGDIVDPLKYISEKDNIY